MQPLPIPSPCPPHPDGTISQFLDEQILRGLHEVADKHPTLVLLVVCAGVLFLAFGALWVIRAFLKGAYDARLKLGTAPALVAGLVSALSFLDRAYKLGVAAARHIPKFGDEAADILDAKTGVQPMPPTEPKP